MYADGGGGTCLSTSLSYFEAYAVDTCIPIQVFPLQSDDKSVIFKAPDDNDDGAEPYVKYYTSERDCNGTHSKVSLSTSCEEEASS